MIQYNQKNRRLRRVRSKLAQNVGIPRLSVFRSNQHIWAQIIDDKHGKTLVSASTKSLKQLKGTKSEKAVSVGQEIAKLAIDKKIINVRFDRGLYRYHGRVKSLAQGAREGGLKF
ncbi:MAG: 50S ribosomal protein L18 [Candidatus Shapirobacteria bacterium]|jgi:large subunit ribosomal protein L18|nr:50S ribosomal protein L18 [Candidatus Shapirobacteria bacterium]